MINQMMNENKKFIINNGLYIFLDTKIFYNNIKKFIRLLLC